ncbi:alpha/beta hydrolase [Brevibacterium marinum]
MLEGFKPIGNSHSGVRISGLIAGSGPPVLLLHGYPQTKHMWHLVAPALAKDHTVVLGDLRGYGDSDKPEQENDRSTYSKREMAADQHALMMSLGFEKYSIAGHDRGGRVAHRLGLDHPEAVDRVALLDIVPTLHMFDNVNRAMASSYFHWFFLALENGMPEALIRADPLTWLRSRFEGRNAGGRQVDPETYDEYARCFTSPGGVEASTADYQSAATIDLDHDRADRDRGRRLMMPLLTLWGDKGYVGRTFDVVEVWKDYADEVEGAAAQSDHYLAEEAPEFVVTELTRFFDPSTADGGGQGS